MHVGESKITDLASLLISQMKRHLFFFCVWGWGGGGVAINYVATWHNKN